MVQYDLLALLAAPFGSSKRHKKLKFRAFFLFSVCPFPHPSNFTVVNAKVTLYIEIYSERML